jgi:hypothetical protein
VTGLAETGAGVRETMSSPAGAPYLTVVAASRNDDHGGGMNRRMQTFVNALVAQCDRHRLPVELLLVDWNPPSDRPPLAEALEWPASAGYCSVRVVQVPNELHARLDHSDRLPLFQMIAKNVGIRRASAPFVVATNVDLVFSDELMQFLARRQLDPGKVYRLDRYDVTDGIDPSWAIDNQLEYCRRNVIRINERNGTHDLRTGEYYRIYNKSYWISGLPPLVALPAGVAYQAWRKAYAKAYWFVAGFNDPRKVPERVRKRLRHLRTQSDVEAPAGTPARELLRARIERFREELTAERARARLHTNASGDFTLMSKEAWIRSRGYLELEMYSMHIDGLVLFQARYTGTPEKYVPHAIYHIEHDAGWKPEPTGAQQLTQRLDGAAIPRISNEELIAYTVEMYKTRQPPDINRDDWGLAGEDLPERTISLPQVRVGYGA